MRTVTLPPSVMTEEDFRILVAGSREGAKESCEAGRSNLAWVNENLLARFSRGRSAFIRKLEDAINSTSTPLCPWGHVGKNH